MVKVVDKCGSTGSQTVDRECDFNDGDDVADDHEIIFEFDSRPRKPNLVACRLRSRSGKKGLEKFAESRLSKAERSGMEIVAELPDGGKIYLDALGSDRNSIKCSRTAPAAQTQAPPAQTGHAQQHAPSVGHAAPPQTMQEPPPLPPAPPHAPQHAHMAPTPQASFGGGRGHGGVPSAPAREMGTVHHRGGSSGRGSYRAGGEQMYDRGGGYGAGDAQMHEAPPPSESQRRRSSPPDDPDAKRRRGAELVGIGETGRSGQSIGVRTNFYRINVNPQLRVAQYELELWNRSGEPIIKVETKRSILSEVPIHLVAQPPVTGYATDGANTLFVANGELALTPQATAAGWKYEDGEFVFKAPAEGQEGGGSSRGAARRFGGKLTLRRAGVQGVYIDFEHFLSAAGGDARRAQLQVLDIVFKAQASSRCKTLGDAFYDAALERTERPWADRHRISNGLNELWLGYRTANVYTAQGPMLQVDRAASCMLAPIRLSEFIQQKLKTQRLELTTTTDVVRLSGIEINKINAKLTEGTRNTKVYSSHRMSPDGKRHLMDYVVRGLDKCRCDEAYFQEVGIAIQPTSPSQSRARSPDPDASRRLLPTAASSHLTPCGLDPDTRDRSAATA